MVVKENSIITVMFVLTGVKGDAEPVILDEYTEDDPNRFVCSDREITPCFLKVWMGLKVDDSFDVVIPGKDIDTFDPELVVEIPYSNFDSVPDDKRAEVLCVGNIIPLNSPGGPVQGMIVEIDDHPETGKVKVDLNNPLCSFDTVRFVGKVLAIDNSNVDEDTNDCVEFEEIIDEISSDEEPINFIRD